MGPLSPGARRRYRLSSATLRPRPPATLGSRAPRPAPHSKLVGLTVCPASPAMSSQGEKPRARPIARHSSTTTAVSRSVRSWTFVDHKCGRSSRIPLGFGPWRSRSTVVGGRSRAAAKVADLVVFGASGAAARGNRLDAWSRRAPLRGGDAAERGQRPPGGRHRGCGPPGRRECWSPFPPRRDEELQDEGPSLHRGGRRVCPAWRTTVNMASAWSDAMPAAGMARELARRPQIVRPARLPVACFWDQAVPGTASASLSASAR